MNSDPSRDKGTTELAIRTAATAAVIHLKRRARRRQGA